MAAPKAGTPEYRWWQQGATDEAAARTEGLSRKIIELQEALEALAMLRPGDTPEALVAALARIYCPELPVRQRIALIRELI
jgi:hypothetical protein